MAGPFGVSGYRILGPTVEELRVPKVRGLRVARLPLIGSNGLHEGGLSCWNAGSRAA